MRELIFKYSVHVAAVICGDILASCEMATPGLSNDDALNLDARDRFGVRHLARTDEPLIALDEHARLTHLYPARKPRQ